MRYARQETRNSSISSTMGSLQRRNCRIQDVRNPIEWRICAEDEFGAQASFPPPLPVSRGWYASPEWPRSYAGGMALVSARDSTKISHLFTLYREWSPFRWQRDAGLHNHHLEYACNRCIDNYQRHRLARQNRIIQT